MPSLIHHEHRDNISPIHRDEVQKWEQFKAPASSDGAWAISAFPELILGHAFDPQALTIEDVVIYTARNEYEDPEYRLRFNVRNVGISTIERYSVNVWHLLP